jgi:hypothetical protein
MRARGLVAFRFELEFALAHFRVSMQALLQECHSLRKYRVQLSAFRIARPQSCASPHSWWERLSVMLST